MEKKLLIFEPSGARILVDAEATYLKAIRESGRYVPADCGGKGTCGKCRIVVQPSPSPTNSDLEHLSEEELESGVRLACQHTVENNRRILIPSEAGEAKILVDALISRPLVPEIGEAGDIGIAIDLGTTTIVCYFIELGSGTQIDVRREINPQIAFGEDVINRLTYAMNNPGGLQELQDVVWSKIATLVESFLEASGTENMRLTTGAMVGNTAMHHLALALPVESLSTAPYKPTETKSRIVQGSDLGLSCLPQCEFYFAPNISGYVGGDALGFILSQALHEYQGVALGIDVGTNGEIIGVDNGELYCCSAAAGPAFEGARIACGMRAQDGAIEHMITASSEAAPELSVLGNSKPVGICGSGVLDAIAELRKVNLIDKSGRLLDGKRIHKIGQHEKAYVIASQNEYGIKKPVFISQKDVREVQLAKAAIRAGAEIVLDKLGYTATNLDAVFLAGAFGNYMKPESALSIGLLPPIDSDKVVPVGNAAGDGAKRILVSHHERETIERISESAKYIELASQIEFNDLFSRATQLTPEVPTIDELTS
ncbi:MAG: ASKHA domain-containing protein [Candidatus Thorarchaeota archaeon]